MTSKFSAHLRLTAAAMALGLGATLALSGAASADPKVAAKVDGSPITDEDIAVAMADIGPGLPQKLEGAARQKYVLDYLIDLKLAAKKAEADKLDQTQEFAKKLAYYRDKLAMEELLGSVAKAATTEDAERVADLVIMIQEACSVPRRSASRRFSSRDARRCGDPPGARRRTLRGVRALSLATSA